MCNKGAFISSPAKGAGCRPGAQHSKSRAYTSYGSYGTSKLANILFVKELARRCVRCWATHQPHSAVHESLLPAGRAETGTGAADTQAWRCAPALSTACRLQRE